MWLQDILVQIVKNTYMVLERPSELVERLGASNEGRYI
jgi:hypothetical protein